MIIIINTSFWRGSWLIFNARNKVIKKTTKSPLKSGIFQNAIYRCKSTMKIKTAH